MLNNDCETPPASAAAQASTGKHVCELISAEKYYLSGNRVDDVCSVQALQRCIGYQSKTYQAVWLS